MCTYQTTNLEMAGSAKGATGWFRLSETTVYLDHPFHASAEHTVNVDFMNPGGGPGSRVAVELDPDSARDLALAILHTLDSAPEGLLSPAG